MAVENIFQCGRSMKKVQRKRKQIKLNKLRNKERKTARDKKRDRDRERELCESDEKNVIPMDRYVHRHTNTHIPYSAKSCHSKGQKGSKIVGELEIVLAF